MPPPPPRPVSPPARTRTPGDSMAFEFQWDNEKAAANVRKHGVTFSEACTASAIRSRPRSTMARHSDDTDKALRIGELCVKPGGCFNRSRLRLHPIHVRESGHTPELPHVRRNDGEAARNGDAGDHEVLRSDRLSADSVADLRIPVCSSLVEGENRHTCQ